MFELDLATLDAHHVVDAGTAQQTEILVSPRTGRHAAADAAAPAAVIFLPLLARGLWCWCCYWCWCLCWYWYGYALFAGTGTAAIASGRGQDQLT